jgi:hypothetical protein
VTEPIILGHAGEQPLELDLDRLVGSHLGIVANAGGGKSGLIRRLLEQTHGVGPMAEVLIDRWPQWTSREDLAGYLGMTASGGTFGTYLSRLAGPELIERDRDRGVRLNPEMMG